MSTTLCHRIFQGKKAFRVLVPVSVKGRYAAAPQGRRAHFVIFRVKVYHH